ncbi:GAF and ANTAR domain-containing protein [Jatrophihabitans fulvus]
MSLDAAAAADLARRFVALNAQLPDQGMPATLERVASLAVETVPGCRWADVSSWSSDSAARTLASSGGVAQELVALQAALRQGPSPSAASRSETMVLPDVRTARRWNELARRVAAETPVRAMVSVPLQGGPAGAVLGLAGDRPDAFTVGAGGAAELFASHTTVVLMNGTHASKATNLRRALETARHISMAVGILRTVHRVDEAAAFGMLRERSQALHRKLFDVADTVNRTGALPEE